MNSRSLIRALIVAPLTLLFVAPAVAQNATGGGSFDGASGAIRKKLDDAIAELNALREEMAAESIPMTREINELEGELAQVRLDYQEVVRRFDARTLDLTNLRGDIDRLEQDSVFLSNLLGEYIRTFESRLHIAELQRYEESLESARLAPENPNLNEEEVYRAQVALMNTSLDRLEELLGGMSFDGTAVDPDGMVKTGTFVLIGPSAIFHSKDGTEVGTGEQRLGSLEPSVIRFGDQLDSDAAVALATDGAGRFPLDPTRGSAHKVESTEETFVEHVQKGGVVMIPIFAMAGLALLVALLKWLGFLFVRKPSRKRVRTLLKAVAADDRPEAAEAAARVKGPTGRMLRAGVEHLGEPKELIEEVLYEHIHIARLKLMRFLPFIAICAASAPLLGLLGTVTGIISTFKLITVFGSGDVKTLSGGISEALITTEFGLIVAIPSLLLHAFLSRKARSHVDKMELAALSFANEVGRSEHSRKEQRAAAVEPVPQTQPHSISASAHAEPQPVIVETSELLRMKGNDLVGAGAGAVAVGDRQGPGESTES